jgi:ribonuclease BN (tRNA processing enzyme)
MNGISMSETTNALQATVLGSYGPILHDDRASSGFVFHIDNEPRLLLDAGGGTAVRFGEASIDPSTIDTALFRTSTPTIRPHSRPS